jgi:hypothetical protein
MKYIILIISFLLCNQSFGQKSLDEGIVRIGQYADYFKEVATRFRLDPRFVVGAAFPEVTRASWTDKAETFLNEQLYVRMGKEYSDYSIGIFQTKPSWAEDIELTLLKYPVLEAKYRELKNKLGNAELEREVRVGRLGNPRVQFIYLCAFVSIMDEMYKDVCWENTEEKLAFYASAYNVGFLKERPKIEAVEKTTQFPWNSGTQRYSFCALEFYKSKKVIKLFK